MAEGNNSKLKILYLMKILLEKTDENHSITMPEIVEALAAYGITAERKSLYSDIENLRVYGLDIIGEKENKAFYYRVASRDFELAELKLLVDSVQSAKFITPKKSNDLIRKIEGMASKYEALQLHRQVFVSGRIKSPNESIFYNIDDIHKAIAANAQITFQYFNWNMRKEQELRHDGKLYEVSPWALSCDDENYYLVAFDAEEDKIKHFRVDKMLHITVTDKRRLGMSRFEEFDMAVYAKQVFGMFGGEEETVQLECADYMAGVIIDRFGKDVNMYPIDDRHFKANVKVALSNQFLSWIMALGDGVKIVGPERVVDRMRAEVQRLAGQYGL